MKTVFTRGSVAENKARLDSRPLSRREREVISAIAAGKSSKQIAIQLSISAWTVSTYLYRVRRKMGVSTNAEAVGKLTLTQ
jgi:DNA-binding CsgD family transcriptional regulator